MQHTLKRAAAGFGLAVLATGIAAPTSVWAAGRYTDVPADAELEAAVEHLAAAGITLGCSPAEPTRYCPDDAVTRRQMALFLHRLSGKGDAAPSVNAATVGGFTAAQLRAVGAASEVAGPRGPAGPAGQAGPVGPVGPQGLTGDTGLQGVQGQAGLSALELWQAIPGNEDATLDDLLAAVKGAKGDRGASALELWRALPGNEDDTLEDLLGALRGEQGPQGLTGAQGETGEQGERGAQGEPGDTGPEGPRGPQGDAGPEGPQGATGATGAAGRDGVASGLHRARAKTVDLPVGVTQAVVSTTVPEGTYAVTAKLVVTRVSNAPSVTCAVGDDSTTVLLSNNNPTTPVPLVAQVSVPTGGGSIAVTCTSTGHGSTATQVSLNAVSVLAAAQPG